MSARRYVRVSRQTQQIIADAPTILRVWAILTLTLGPIAFGLAFWWAVTH